MNAIVTAGGEVEPNQPLYEAAHGGLKSMLRIGGKPMVQWVLDALSKAGDIDRVIVIGLPLETDLECAHPLKLLPDNGDLMKNIRAASNDILTTNPTETHAILASSDIPALRGEIVDWLVCQAKSLDQDIYFTFIEKKMMEATFPGVKFNSVHLKDKQLCSGHLHCFRLRSAVEDSPLWKRVTTSRKSPLHQASLLGYDTMFFLMLRQLTLENAEAMVRKRLGVQGQAILCPYPEVGFDIEKAQHLEVINEYLSGGYERNLPDAE